MSQTIEAVINEDGAVRLLKPVHLSGVRRALVTILDEPPAREGDLDAGYRAMALDEARESEALEWAEITFGDASDETR